MLFDVATLLDKTITRLAKYKETRKADDVIAIFMVMEDRNLRACLDILIICKGLNGPNQRYAVVEKYNFGLGVFVMTDFF